MHEKSRCFCLGGPSAETILLRPRQGVDLTRGSVANPDPQGSASFGRIRIRNFGCGSGSGASESQATKLAFN
jgi:hypothetical protein